MPLKAFLIIYLVNDILKKSVHFFRWLVSFMNADYGMIVMIECTLFSCMSFQFILHVMIIFTSRYSIWLRGRPATHRKIIIPVFLREKKASILPIHQFSWCCKFLILILFYVICILMFKNFIFNKHQGWTIWARARRVPFRIC